VKEQLTIGSCLERGGISMVQVGQNVVVLLICMLRTSFATFWLENYCKENK